MTKIRAGIVGAAGYTGGELIRLLIHHPNVDIVFANSGSQSGKPVYSIHKDLLGDTDVLFSDELKPDNASDLAEKIDVLFLCVGHGDAQQFLQQHAIPKEVKIIDLSQDFRLSASRNYPTHAFVYGLPELQRDAIRSAQAIANPGCFATNIQLALLPLADKNLLKHEIQVNATTGSTGAGQKPGATTHFSWRNDNLSIYKAFEHQHLKEIGESLTQLQPDFPPAYPGSEGMINFLPQRGDFSRGIFSASYLECDLPEESAIELYEAYYTGHPFTQVSRSAIDLKQVVNTNKCFLHIEKHGKKLLITSIIDNLLKGASGQAVQNMNLLFDLEETAGLRLKATAF